MTDRPIVFSAPMVRALLEGRKTQTRRIIKKPAAMDALATFGPNFLTLSGNRDLLPISVFPGDRLYVREAFSYETLDVDRNGFMPPWYWADGNPSSGDFTRPKPSIHMPRWASRLTLIVTDVRVQRLQDITEADAVAEGIEQARSGRFYDPTVSRAAAAHLGGMFYGPKPAFEVLWNSLHGPDAWDANPWVCAITFDVIRANIDSPEAAR